MIQLHALNLKRPSLDRFNDFWSTVTYFNYINPSQTSEENKDYFQSLCKIYKHDINLDEAILEYYAFKDLYASIHSSLFSELQLKKVQPFLTEKRMASGLPNLSKIYKIYLTLPVRIATAERSFSRLKLIKNYLRLTMTNKRTSVWIGINFNRA